MMRPAAVTLLLFAAAFPAAAETWQDRLYTPTQITKLGDLYFIVVCWQHRIIYSDKLGRPMAEWKTLDDTIAGPHSIATDGELYVAEDTGRHRLRVYQRTGDAFEHVQTLGPFGKRTHRVRYDKPTQAFYVVSSNEQVLTKLRRDGNRLKVQYVKKLPFLKGAYTRSLTICGPDMFFTSGPGVITKVRYRDDRLKVVATYKVPQGMEGGNDVFRTEDGWWYVTATPQRIVRARSLADLDAGKFEDVYRTLGCKGTPYYLAKIDGRYFVPQITQYSAVISFVHKDGKIADVQTHFDFGPPKAVDKQRVREFPR